MRTTPIRRSGIALRWFVLGAVVALLGGGQGQAAVGAGVSTGPRAIFQPLKPRNILDTRKPGQGPAITGGGVGRLLQVAGAGGVPSDATAVVANVTAIQPTARSFLTVYPAGQTRPNTPNLFFGAAQTVSNVVAMKLGTGGAVRIFNKTGSVQVTVDVQGFYVGHDHDDRYYTKAEADTRFFQGSTLILVNGDGAPADNGAALAAAMAAITDASADKPYTIRLSPGLYDVGTGGLDVKPFVELQGSGEDRSILTAPGSHDLSPNDGGTYGTVRPAGGSSVRSLTVRNSGGPSTIAVGIEIGDGTARVSDVTVDVGGGSDDNIGITPNHFATAPRLELDGATIDVAAGGIGGGIGALASDQYDVIAVRDSSVDVTGAGFGIVADASSASGSRIRVSDTEVTVAGGGTALGGKANGQMMFDDVSVTVTGGTTTVGIGGSGSGFHPVLQDSTISVSGGSSSNKGFDGAQSFSATVQGSRITASGANATAMELGLGPTDSGSAFVDGSVLTATTIVNSINAGTVVKVGASKLAGTTIVNGAGTFVCVASYESDYSLLSSTCT
jgi:hypothetical protein